MPDTLPLVHAVPVQEPARVPPEPLLHTHAVWAALRQQLLGTAPDSEGVLRIRALLTHLYPTRGERVRALHALFSATPAAFRCMAEQCGWSAELEPCGVSWDLAIIAAVFAETSAEEAQ